MADWSRQFFDPIELPDGRKLHTLRDAAEFITKLPAEQHDLPHWQTAMEVLLLSVEHGRAGADPVLAWIAKTRALNADRDWPSPEISTPRRKRAKRHRIVQ